MDIKCVQGSWLFAVGELSIRIEHGQVEVFGAEYSSGDIILVPKYRSVPIYVINDSVLNIDFEDGYIAESKEALIPDDWKKLAERLYDKSNGFVVMVIGNIDTGKTGLLTFLANTLYLRGKKVAIIDADVGQSDIGPPTTIGLGFMEHPIIHLSEVPLYDAFFVGSVTPAGVLDRMIVGTYEMVRKAKDIGADVVLLDTTGWVGDRGGRELKLGKISVINPDLLVLIEKFPGELNYIEKSIIRYSGEIIRVRAAPKLKARNWEERRELRKMMYEKEFEDAREVVISLDSVKISYGFLGTGTTVSNDTMTILEGILGDISQFYIEESWDSLLIVSNVDVPPRVIDELKKKVGKREVVFLKKDKLKYLAVSLHDSTGRFLGLGIILDFDLVARKLLVYTRARLDTLASIQIGHIKINPNGEELEKLSPWSI